MNDVMCFEGFDALPGSSIVQKNDCLISSGCQYFSIRTESQFCDVFIMGDFLYPFTIKAIAFQAFYGTIVGGKGQMNIESEECARLSQSLSTVLVRP